MRLREDPQSNSGKSGPVAEMLKADKENLELEKL